MSSWFLLDSLYSSLSSWVSFPDQPYFWWPSFLCDHNFLIVSPHLLHPDPDQNCIWPDSSVCWIPCLNTPLFRSYIVQILLSWEHPLRPNTPLFRSFIVQILLCSEHPLLIFSSVQILPCSDPIRPRSKVFRQKLPRWCNNTIKKLSLFGMS